MGGLKIDTGGGGLVIGDGGVASGVGGNIIYSGEGPAISKADLAQLIATLGALKAALIGADVGASTSLAARVGELEQTALNNGGRIAATPTRRLLAKIRYAALGHERVAAALKEAAPYAGRRSAVTDVFISYKREDRRRVKPIADALRQLRVNVWIDDELLPGDSFTDEICEEIDVCRAQIVCWSAAASTSDWVRGEAEIGRRREALVCVQLEPCRIHPPFNMLHTENLSGWRGDATHAGWSKVLRALGDKLGRSGLAELAHALAARDPAALSAWTRAHPQDPFSTGAAHG